MWIRVSKSVGVVGVIVAFTACSVKKDTVFSRSSHSLATEYNILFNGSNAYDDGRTQLLNGFDDDFTKLLSIDRFEASDEIEVFLGDIKDSNFRKAEEKATKGIQKHAMNIDNRERNPQTDEAYMLLGKTRYYAQRFVPSQEAFQYIIYNYPNSDKMSEARIWREKTNIQLYKEQIAINNIKKIFKQEIVSRQNYSEAMATMAQAYIKLERLDSAANVLKIAADLTKNKFEKGRYHYILGQLHNTFKNPAKAHAHFSKVVALNRRIPRVYLVNAEIELLKLTPLTLEKTREMVYKKLLNMLKNRENRPFLDIIHRQMALYQLHLENFKESKRHFDKSTQKTKNKSIKVLNYTNLSKMYFDLEQYTTTSKYYDSIISNLDLKDEQYYPTVKKRAHIKNIVKYELLSQRGDSILKLVHMPQDARVRYFKEYIAGLELTERKQQEKNITNTQSAAPQSATSSTFYFYNKIALDKGKLYFFERWGNRPLNDNWKYTEGQAAVEVKVEGEASESVVKKDTSKTNQKEDRYQLSHYISQIPKEQKSIDSIRAELNVAYYQLGLLYKDKFKNYELSEQKLKALLKNNPPKELIVPVLYNLYKLYSETQKKTEAEAIKRDLLNKYPESAFAKALKDKNFDKDKQVGEAEKLYATLYAKFNNQDFKDVIALSDEALPKLLGNDIVPKILILKASAVARLHGLEDYKKILVEITLNYPNTFEAKMAKNLLDNVVATWLKKKIEPLSSTGDYWKIVFPFENDETTGLESVYATLSEIIREFSYEQIHLSRDIFDHNQIFLVVHGFSSKERAQGFQELIKVNKQYRIERKNFVTSSRDYEIIQVRKITSGLVFE